MNTQTTALAEQLCKVEKQIKEFEAGIYGEMQVLSKTLKTALIDELKKEGMSSVETAEGEVLLVHSRGNLSVDLVALQKDLGEDTVKKYQKEGKDSEFIKVALTK